ncbi:flagellar hook-associated protein FlgK [Fictibacillus sp. 7GRE50]|uniref:flagellar hook-associated protein FlgK n=1 Tax=Fictibacillus sp. 7GRE50 TaxID=2745878 RepID=UPI0018CD740D|nr:flagellar hook-associated protein FlgK [Fictibacillus sp. 7GRE50]MBH0164053.1 flagellar hook-associated protein FlgK [Fictibacillus sp. 7GRE50]
MRSTFHGLETARRGMFTQQTALQTTGHNIANANTPGYSRQRVNFVQTEPYPAASMNRPQIPGQMGTGVAAGSVQRVREGFLDTQFRTENNKFGHWETKSNALKKMEDILNEPSDTGLSKTMDRFWQSLQDLAVHPQDEGARSVVLQRGIALSDTFNHMSTSLDNIRKDMGFQADVTVKEINSIIDKINDINIQISEVEPHGYLPNDLYDKRDSLVDQLSGLINIKVERVQTADPSLIDLNFNPDGKYKIHLLDDKGASLGLLVNADTNTITAINSVYDKTTNELTALTFGTNNLLSGSEKTQGKLQALRDAYQETYPNMIKNLDDLAHKYIQAFNAKHSSGVGLDGAASGNFFDPGTPIGAAKNMKVILSDVKKIAAASSGGKNGDGSNALNLADVRDDVNFQSVFEGYIGSMAVDAQKAEGMSTNSIVLLDSVDKRRQSISGVSLDEEMTNMIQYQHAYNAAARNITVVDEMLDKIINGMGVGGR